MINDLNYSPIICTILVRFELFKYNNYYCFNPMFYTVLVLKGLPWIRSACFVLVLVIL